MAPKKGPTPRQEQKSKMSAARRGNVVEEPEGDGDDEDDNDDGVVPEVEEDEEEVEELPQKGRGKKAATKPSTVTAASDLPTPPSSTPKRPHLPPPAISTKRVKPTRNKANWTDIEVGAFLDNLDQRIESHTFPWGVHQWEEVRDDLITIMPGIERFTAKQIARKFKTLRLYVKKTGQPGLPRNVARAIHIYRDAQAAGGQSSSMNEDEEEEDGEDNGGGEGDYDTTQATQEQGTPIDGSDLDTPSSFALPIVTDKKARVKPKQLSAMQEMSHAAMERERRVRAGQVREQGTSEWMQLFALQSQTEREHRLRQEEREEKRREEELAWRREQAEKDRAEREERRAEREERRMDRQMMAMLMGLHRPQPPQPPSPQRQPQTEQGKESGDKGGRGKESGVEQVE